MFNTKKVLALVLSAALAVSLAACQKSVPTDTQSNNGGSQQVQKDDDNAAENETKQGENEEENVKKQEVDPLAQDILAEYEKYYREAGRNFGMLDDVIFFPYPYNGRMYLYNVDTKDITFIKGESGTGFEQNQYYVFNFNSKTYNVDLDIYDLNLELICNATGYTGGIVRIVDKENIICGNIMLTAPDYAIDNGRELPGIPVAGYKGELSDSKCKVVAVHNGKAYGTGSSDPKTGTKYVIDLATMERSEEEFEMPKWGSYSRLAGKYFVDGSKYGNKILNIETGEVLDNPFYTDVYNAFYSFEGEGYYSLEKVNELYKYVSYPETTEKVLICEGLSEKPVQYYIVSPKYVLVYENGFQFAESVSLLNVETKELTELVGTLTWEEVQG